MKKMVLVEVTKAHELQAERPSAERPTKGDLISESFSYCLKSQKKVPRASYISIHRTVDSTSAQGSDLAPIF